ncbi:MAG: gamma-glutamylcyclotransferase [Chloracidobacterium sp.]|nr:gamma-glutamylcyclotransferase [Chloracidobacterium sp.]
MWVFGYGSLMWDDWEKEFQGVKHNRAKLNGYHRDFNKKSTRNWGTSERGCPTLGLEELEGAECVGSAFEFDDKYRDSIMTHLKGREGESFDLPELDVELENGQVVKAVTPVNRLNNTYLGSISVEDRARNARVATGKDGKCSDYIQNIHRHLNDLSIDDLYVQRMWEALQK